MLYLIEYATDVGIKKSVNQDSVCIKNARTKDGNVAMALICDGMGGLSSGEYASGSVVEAISTWFNKRVPVLLSSPSFEVIKKEIFTELMEANKRLMEYGRCRGLQLGTTASCVFILPDGNFCIAHIGDSRVYKISANSITQLTDDHTYVAEQVRKGLMTQMEASYDPKRNVLLQCIGIMEDISPDFSVGKLSGGEYLLLCSDGFCHVLSDAEILEKIHEKGCCNRKDMKELLMEMISLNLTRCEKENITAILVKLQ